MLPPLAHKCSLQKPPGLLQWSQRAAEKLKEISADGATVFNVNILIPGETSVVQLMLNNNNVSLQLYPETTGCYVSQFNSFDDIWIHRFEDVEALNILTEKMSTADTWPDVGNAEVGELVATMFEDNVWYRAKVTEKTDDGYKLHFVDYGNCYFSNNVKKLMIAEYSDIVFAHSYKLEALPHSKWVEDAEKKFEGLTYKGKNNL